MDGILAKEALILIRLCISNIIMLCFVNKLKITATMTHIYSHRFGKGKPASSYNSSSRVLTFYFLTLSL